MKIAVAGGTGTIGSEVVAAIRAAGHTPVVLARSTGVDVEAGFGPDRLEGARRLIDVTNVVTMRKAKSERFFAAGTTALLEVGRQAGVEHHVALSIVGCDRVDFGYYFGKRRQEQLVLAGPVPATVVRSTQVHELADQLVRRGGRLLVVPRMVCRPLAAAEVAAALVEIALGDAAGRVPEIAGPEVRQLRDMVGDVVAGRGLRRVIVPVKLWGEVGDKMAGGALLPTGPGPRGRQTFDAWLARLVTK